ERSRRCPRDGRAAAGRVTSRHPSSSTGRPCGTAGPAGGSGSRHVDEAISARSDVSDEQDPFGVPPAWSEGMRRLRELGEQIAAAGRAAAAAGARVTPPALAQPLAGYTEQLLRVSS